jgi:hypothetical protein
MKYEVKALGKAEEEPAGFVGHGAGLSEVQGRRKYF